MFINTWFDVPNRNSYDISKIKQWARFIIDDITYELATGDKFVDQYYGNVEIVGFSAQIELARTGRSYAQPVIYLDYDEFFNRIQPIAKNIGTIIFPISVCRMTLLHG